MPVAFIRQVNDTMYHIKRLEERANSENSSFRHAISAARIHIENIQSHYHEVLQRDAIEDEAYIPPLREVE